MRSDTAYNDDVLFSALKCIHRIDFDPIVESVGPNSELCLQREQFVPNLVDLRLVGRDNSDPASQVFQAAGGMNLREAQKHVGHKRHLV